MQHNFSVGILVLINYQHHYHFILFTAPVSLKVQHKNVTKGKPVAFDISCNGR